MDRLIEEKTAENIAVRAGMNDRVLIESCRSPERSVNENTLFDMASVTKILAVTNLCLIALDRELISLSDPASKYFTCGREKREPNHIQPADAYDRHRAGLGYVYVDGRYAQTGKLFPEGSVGHCGHTGQSVFVHPESDLYVIILSDATLCAQRKYGAYDYATIMGMRAEVHNDIKADME